MFCQLRPLSRRRPLMLAFRRICLLTKCKSGAITTFRIYSKNGNKITNRNQVSPVVQEDYDDNLNSLSCFTHIRAMCGISTSHPNRSVFEELWGVNRHHRMSIYTKGSSSPHPLYCEVGDHECNSENDRETLAAAVLHAKSNVQDFHPFSSVDDFTSSYINGEPGRFIFESG
jgi:hypothetical protein